MPNVSTQTMQKPFAVPARLFAAYVRLQDFTTTLTQAFAAWHRNASANTRLYYLNDHMRRDIGVNGYNIGHDPVDSFWRD